jgi:hypothetical protein
MPSMSPGNPRVARGLNDRQPRPCDCAFVRRGQARLKGGKPLVHSGWVRATAGSAVLRFQCGSPRRRGVEGLRNPPAVVQSAQLPAVDPTVDEQLQHRHYNTVAGAQPRSWQCSPTRVRHLLVPPRTDLKRKKAFAETGDKKHLTREVVLQSPEFERSVKASLGGNVRPVAALKPWAYYLADESSLTCYMTHSTWIGGRGDRGLRQWLERAYGSLEKLNSAWGTAFQDWDSVVPMTTEEAQNTATSHRGRTTVSHGANSCRPSPARVVARST